MGLLEVLSAEVEVGVSCQIPHLALQMQPCKTATVRAIK